MTAFKYDVAVSFLSPDLVTALALRDSLTPALEVFVYSHNQEAVAGTDGLESFRAVFRTEARLVVVLYRDGWGQTNWTRVEEEAITDRFLKEGVGFLCFVGLDQKSTPPRWVPDKLIRLNLVDYSLEETIGVIKARAQEAGSALRQDTAATRAARSQALAEFLRETEALRRDPAGVAAVREEVRRISATVTALVGEARASAPGLPMEVGADDVSVVLRAGRVGVVGVWQNRYVNSLDQSPFFIRAFSSKLILPGEKGLTYFREPNKVRELRLWPERVQAQGWCWRTDDGKIMNSVAVSDLILKYFFDIFDQASRNQLPPLD